ncbi:GGDEF domain-containing protein [Mangrovihabitans endophyticus]|uniref:GGDEF domain-containing protein n=1 Tax=Mangrovihabitans endophyticus TaxID=1751298 RepID=A0A8J3C4T2_9ACTN|nr:GGDEF domain-containing protein [Mangrovihabitans endophyticus]GGL09354.1 hypothetical protein GCM10012284_50020 [Mangrovihabitans endophyticus]
MTAATRRYAVLLGGLTLLYLVALATTVTAGVTHRLPIDAVSGPAMVLFAAVALAGAVLAARHRGLDQRTRRAWATAACSFAMLLATPVIFLITGPVPFPSPGDGTHLAFGLLLLVAVQQFPVASAAPRERAKAGLDAATVVVGGAMLLWYAVIGPHVQQTQTSPDVVVAAGAYPVTDLAVLFGLARVLLRGADRSARLPLWLITAGMVVFFCGDAYLGIAQAQTAQVERTPWQFACWLTTHFLLAAAAVTQLRRAATPGKEAGGLRRNPATRLPYAAVAVGYALMVLAVLRDGRFYPWSGLVLGAIAITALVVARQALTQRDTDDLAATDPLTGLANRARLHDGLDRALTRAARNGGGVAVLLVDMNGFKQVNDTLGHHAGDRLLAEFAQLMRRSVLGSDLVARLGGDEFAIVLTEVSAEDAAVAVAQRLQRAMAEPVDLGGVWVQPSAAIGVAASAGGVPGADELLHRADVAMYRAKRSGASTACATWSETVRTTQAG